MNCEPQPASWRLIPPNIPAAVSSPSWWTVTVGDLWARTDPSFSCFHQVFYYSSRMETNSVTQVTDNNFLISSICCIFLDERCKSENAAYEVTPTVKHSWKCKSIKVVKLSAMPRVARKGRMSVWTGWISMAVNLQGTTHLTSFVKFVCLGNKP